jgi:Skp family chaperone for outer membrane proteins
VLANLKRFQVPVAVAIIAACITGSSVLAQNTPAAAGGGYKIGVVDLNKLVAEYPKRKQKYEALQKEVDQQQGQIDQMLRGIQQQEETLKASAASLTDDQRRQAVDKLEQDRSAWRLEVERRQRSVDRQEEEVLREVMNDIEAAIGQVAQSQNFHLVLNAKGNSRAVVWHHSSVDITSSVEAILNRR